MQQLCHIFSGNNVIVITWYTQYQLSVTVLVSNPINDAENSCKSFKTSRISGKEKDVHEDT